jgi:hypothetical protein
MTSPRNSAGLAGAVGVAIRTAGYFGRRLNSNKEIEKCIQSVVFAGIVEKITRAQPGWMSRMTSGWRSWET